MIVFRALLELGHQNPNDISSRKFVTTSILEVTLNPFELVGFAPAERDIGAHLISRRRGV
ncbi:hypothetical protein HTG_14160 [Natrinema mahii]|nr:hypothetical protein HTG_14160 [Natrinema mahii]